MIALTRKLVRVMVFDLTPLPSRSDRLFTWLATRENLNMDHVMLLRFAVLIIDAWVEYQVTGSHFLESEDFRADVELVGLVPTV
jgi:hypothetical protein